MRGKDKSPRRRKPGKVSYIVNNMHTSCLPSTFREMRRLQNNVEHLIPKLPFSRLVREIFLQLKGDYRIQLAAMQALQEAAEKYITDLMSDANRCCAHAKRVTLFPNDIRLVLDLRGVLDPGFHNM